MSVNLYVWEMTKDGTPAQIVLDKCGITSKQRLKDLTEYIASNIDMVKQCGSLDAALNI